MPQTSPDASRWAAYMQDVIASDASIREGLQDEDAIPLMDWGRAQASYVAAQSPELDEETAATKANTLNRLMTTISRAVVHRHKQGADWLRKVFSRLNKTSQNLYGEAAPVMSDAAIDAWIADHANHENGALLRDLLARFTPADSTRDAAPGAAPDAAPDTAPDTSPGTDSPESGSGPTLLSDAVDLPGWTPPVPLPGRALQSPGDSEQDSTSHTGENDEQE